MKRRDEEHQAQAAVLSWAAMQTGAEPRLKLLFAIPNGGHRDPRVAAKLKREGVRAGVPDLCLPVPRPAGSDHLPLYHSLYIELKTPSGRIQGAQRWWLASLRNEGHAVAVCRGAEQAIATLAFYLNLPNPTRALSALHDPWTLDTSL